MNTNNLLLIGLAVVVVFVLYYYGTGQFCPNCGQKTNGICAYCGPSLTIPVTSEEAQKVLHSFARGCIHRLRGVVREDLASIGEVSDFMTSGNNKLIVITNIDPEIFVEMISEGRSLSKLNAVAVSSSIVNGKKNYLVISIINGSLRPVGEPKQNFIDAFEYLDKNVRSQLGPDSNNQVFYIDEDVECPSEDVTVLPMEESSSEESCCGRFN